MARLGCRWEGGHFAAGENRSIVPPSGPAVKMKAHTDESPYGWRDVQGNCAISRDCWRNSISLIDLDRRCNSPLKCPALHRGPLTANTRTYTATKRFGRLNGYLTNR